MDGCKQSSITVADAANRGRIMVVDDEPLIADGFGIQLRMNGYQPEIFTDPVEALSSLLEAPDRYDLIIADQKMPKLTGGELLDECRRVAPSKPFIICSGHLGKNSAIAAKADASCTKPFSFAHLRETIDRLLSTSAQVD